MNYGNKFDVQGRLALDTDALYHLYEQLSPPSPLPHWRALTLPLSIQQQRTHEHVNSSHALALSQFHDFIHSAV